MDKQQWNEYRDVINEPNQFICRDNGGFPQGIGHMLERREDSTDEDLNSKATPIYCLESWSWYGFSAKD